MNKRNLMHYESTCCLSMPLKTYYYQNIKLWFGLLLLLLVFSNRILAQDPSLPPTNLGMVNVFDGMGGKSGFVYQGVAQVFQTQKVMNDLGQDLHTTLKVNALVQVNQIIYQTAAKVLGGHLGFMFMIPIVQITTSNTIGFATTVNPGVVGDITQGVALQWSERKLFGKKFSQRMEIDATLPVGSYNKKYNINPSTHFYTLSGYHAFTLMLNDRASISIRNQFNYNTQIIGQGAKAGSFYNGNYSIDYAILSNLRVEAVSYFLGQINQDSYAGDSHHYQQRMGIGDTKEKVFGYGAGIAYFTKEGNLIEAKAFFEAAAKNRVQGYRSTIRIAIPLN